MKQAEIEREGPRTEDACSTTFATAATTPRSLPTARVRPGAPVSMPLAWEQLGAEVGPVHFTVTNSPARVANTPEPWADFRASEAPLPTG
jgi:DNA primase